MLTTVLVFWACNFTHFQTLTDPRQEGKINHPLSELIAIALCASICGIDTWADVERFANMKEDWFTKFLKLEHGIPSHDTFSRVFALLDTEEMYQYGQSLLNQ